jgi:hypothetical protein
MAEYQLGKDHYLHHRGRDGVEPRLHSKGERIKWDGTPSLSMVPIDAEAKKRVEETNAKRAETHQKLRATANAPRVGWTPAMEQSFTKGLQPEAADQQVDSRPVTKSRRARN